MKNDKLDSIGIAKLGLKPDLQVSVMPVKLVLELRALSRNYYSLMDIRSAYVNQLMAAASSAKIFGCNLDSVYFNISITLTLIKGMDSAIADTMTQVRSLVQENHFEKFIQLIYRLNSITGIGFLSAVTIMCEIGDFSVFKSPKQLFVYFGMDPEVKQSGKFNATEVHMSKRSSRIARRALFAATLACIRKKRSGEAVNPYLYEYYQEKASAKPKMVALGAVMHKISNYVFAVLRNEADFVLRSPQKHRLACQPQKLITA